MSNQVRAHIFISGRVKRVLFRDTMRRRAKRLGVKGWVRNLKDNRVEAVLEGEKEKVKELLKWAKRGPFLARIAHFDLKWEDYKSQFNKFFIKNP